MHCYVVLPAFNEQDGLPLLLERLRKTAEALDGGLTAVVVNDGSTDATLEAARRGAGDLRVEVVSHARNEGLGQALLTGLQTAVELAGMDDAIVVMDADDTHDPLLIERMLSSLSSGAGIAIASRFVEGGDHSTAPAYRRGLSRAAATTFRLVLPVSRGVSDFTSGYRAYRASLLRRAMEHWGHRLVEEPGFACMVELLIKLRPFVDRIDEVPLVLRYDRKLNGSKLRLFRTLWQYVLLAVRSRLEPTPREVRLVRESQRTAS